MNGFVSILSFLCDILRARVMFFAKKCGYVVGNYYICML